jgi:hypothetical protein
MLTGQPNNAKLALLGDGQKTLQGCKDALDQAPENLGISLSPQPSDQIDTHYPPGGPGSLVCVRTNNGNLVLLGIVTVRQATDTDGREQEVRIAILNVWPPE